MDKTEISQFIWDKNTTTTTCVYQIPASSYVKISLKCLAPCSYTIVLCYNGEILPSCPPLHKIHTFKTWEIYEWCFGCANEKLFSPILEDGKRGQKITNFVMKPPTESSNERRNKSLIEVDPDGRIRFKMILKRYSTTLAKKTMLSLFLGLSHFYPIWQYDNLTCLHANLTSLLVRWWKEGVTNGNSSRWLI